MAGKVTQQGIPEADAGLPPTHRSRSRTSKSCLNRRCSYKLWWYWHNLRASPDVRLSEDERRVVPKTQRGPHANRHAGPARSHALCAHAEHYTAHGAAVL